MKLLIQDRLPVCKAALRRLAMKTRGLTTPPSRRILEKPELRGLSRATRELGMRRERDEAFWKELLELPFSDFLKTSLIQKPDLAKARGQPKKESWDQRWPCAVTIPLAMMNLHKTVRSAIGPLGVQCCEVWQSVLQDDLQQARPFATPCGLQGGTTSYQWHELCLEPHSIHGCSTTVSKTPLRAYRG